jgi:ribonuclease Z
VASPESFERSGTPAGRVKSVIAHHVTPEQAGEIFARTKPRLAVYSHIVQPHATDLELLAPTRTKYSGPVEVAEDLMVIEVGETIDVDRSQPRDD